MKIFLDANVLVSVLNKEYPVFTHSARILSLANQQNIEIYTSPICLAIAYYFAEKKSKSSLAKQKIDTLCQFIKIAANNVDGVQKTLQNKKINDFEDGLEYYAAHDYQCHCIITENKKDFHFSEIEVLDCKEFTAKYFGSI